MSVPGRDEDGRVASWFAYDTAERRPVASGEKEDIQDVVALDRYLADRVGGRGRRPMPDPGASRPRSDVDPEK